jgi:hypothetical protein
MLKSRDCQGNKKRNPWHLSRVIFLVLRAGAREDLRRLRNCGEIQFTISNKLQLEWL